jgi:hypothetical protein
MSVTPALRNGKEYLETDWISVNWDCKVLVGNFSKHLKIDMSADSFNHGDLLRGKVA